MAVPVLGVVHVNVNCSDLARSLAFWRDAVGLTPLSHTAPAPQPGAGFGLAGRVQWDAWLLHDARGQGGPAVDLLEWKTPRPCREGVAGEAERPLHALGFARLCLQVADLDAAHARLAAAGARCLAPPAETALDAAGSQRVRFFCARDPDGAAVELLELPAADPRPALLHVNLNCSDLARSSAWYREVLGLRCIGEARPGPADGAPFGLPGRVQYAADFLVPPPPAAPFVLDLLEWRTPRPVGRPLAAANALGVFRLAYLVEDAFAAHAELGRLGVACPPPCWLEMGDELPIDGLHALFFRDPDGTCIELIERPRLAGAPR